MQEFITRANIEHFLRLLADEPDEAKRWVLERMLTEEKAKLDSLGVTHTAWAAISLHPR